MTERLSSTLEDYLEAILHIEQKKRFARVRDISKAQAVAKSAVTAALQTLSEMALVNYQPYEPVTLTSKGMEKAKISTRTCDISFPGILNILKIVVLNQALSIQPSTYAIEISGTVIIVVEHMGTTVTH